MRAERRICGPLHSEETTFPFPPQPLELFSHTDSEVKLRFTAAQLVGGEAKIHSLILSFPLDLELFKFRAVCQPLSVLRNRHGL